MPRTINKISRSHGHQNSYNPRSKPKDICFSGGRRTCLPENFTKIDRIAQLMLSGPLSKVELSNTEFITINTKTAFQTHFWEIENPTC